MSPGGPAEEAGKVAAGFIEVMKTEPLALALVVMNIALMGLFYIILDRVSTRTREREIMMANEQKEVRELLARCVVVPNPGMRLQSGEDRALTTEEREKMGLPPKP